MSTKRRKFSASKKAKIALESIKGELTLAQIAAKYAVHATQVNTWKKLEKWSRFFARFSVAK